MPVEPNATLPRFAFAYSTSSADVRGREARRADEQQRRLHHQAHRLERLERIVGQVLVEMVVDRVVVEHDQDRVAVRRRARGFRGPDRAAGAGLVLDEDRLPERLGEHRRHDARDEVGGAAGGVGHDHAHRLRRKGLRERRGRDGERGEHADRDRRSHDSSSSCTVPLRLVPDVDGRLARWPPPEASIAPPVLRGEPADAFLQPAIERRARARVVGVRDLRRRGDDVQHESASPAQPLGEDVDHGRAGAAREARREHRRVRHDPEERRERAAALGRILVGEDADGAAPVQRLQQRAHAAPVARHEPRAEPLPPALHHVVPRVALRPVHRDHRMAARVVEAGELPGAEVRRGPDQALAAGEQPRELVRAPHLAHEPGDPRRGPRPEDRQLGERLAGLDQRAEDEPLARAGGRARAGSARCESASGA